MSKVPSTAKSELGTVYYKTKESLKKKSTFILRFLHGLSVSSLKIHLHRRLLGPKWQRQEE